VINARSIATLGLGFGVVAVATLGFLGTPDLPVAPTEPISVNTGGGSGFVKGSRSYREDYASEKNRIRRIRMEDEEVTALIVAFTEII